MLQLKSSRNEQHAVICFFLWAKKCNASEIHYEMRPVYGDKCFTRPAIHIWFTKFACGRENIVDKERRVRHYVATSASFFASGIQKLVDRWDKCLNKLGQYVEK